MSSAGNPALLLSIQDDFYHTPGEAMLIQGSKSQRVIDWLGMLMQSQYATMFFFLKYVLRFLHKQCKVIFFNLKI